MDSSTDDSVKEISSQKLVKNTDLAKQTYWDTRFKEEESYEWLLSFKQIASYLTPILKLTDKVLLVGCGNSDFSADLYDAGFVNLVNIDFSGVVIENMRRKNAERVKMEWRVRSSSFV
jgi:2-polyprenyl-3-methyl-5-hydroxy-6-metoxy-1,4-benzoquinol methylase